MVTSSDILFWTGKEVSEEDAARYTAACIPQLEQDGGSVLSGETYNEALCYLIASKLLNKEGGGKQQESLGGYSYSRRSLVYTSHWLDLYHELLDGVLNASKYSECGAVNRVDENMLRLNRRYRNGYRLRE